MLAAYQNCGVCWAWLRMPYKQNAGRENRPRSWVARQAEGPEALATNPLSSVTHRRSCIKACSRQVLAVRVDGGGGQADGRTQDVVGDGERVDQRHRHAPQLAAQRLHQAIDGLGLHGRGEWSEAGAAPVMRPHKQRCRPPNRSTSSNHSSLLRYYSFKPSFRPSFPTLSLLPSPPCRAQ